MVAATLEFTEGRVAAARVAVGACSPVAERLPALEAALLGASRDRLADLVDAEHLAPLSPIDDVRGSAAYRRDAVSHFAAPRSWRASPDEGRLHPQRPVGRLEVRRSRGLPKCCATISGSPAPRSAAMPAIAAPARCCSTAGRSAPAWWRSPRSQAARSRPSRAWHGNGTLAAAAGSFLAPWRRPVRHLHARHARWRPAAAAPSGAGRRAARSRMRSAACSAAAPATARSSTAVLDATAPLPAAPPAGGARRRATGTGRWRGQGRGPGAATAPTARPTTPVAPRRPLAAPSRALHASATLAPLRRRFAAVLTAEDVPGATATASIPTSRTSRCSPTARCAIAARRSSPWSASASVAGDPRRGVADHLGAACRRSSASTPPWPPTHPCCRPTSRATS